MGLCKRYYQNLSICTCLMQSNRERVLFWKKSKLIYVHGQSESLPLHRGALLFTKALAVDLVGGVDCDKGIFVILIDDVHQIGILVDGEGDHQHLMLLAGITASGSDDGRGAVDLFDDLLIDYVRSV